MQTSRFMMETKAVTIPWARAEMHSFYHVPMMYHAADSRASAGSRALLLSERLMWSELICLVVYLADLVMKMLWISALRPVVEVCLAAIALSQPDSVMSDLHGQV